jgi:hypothetical protein
LLYADKVTLCSYTATIIKRMHDIEALSSEERMRFCLAFLRGRAEHEELVRVIEVFLWYKSLSRSQRRQFSYETIQKYKTVKHQYEEIVEQITEEVKRMAIAGGAAGLQSALKSGLVDLYQFKSEDLSEALCYEYFSVIAEATTSSATYPLLDDLTGELIRLGVEERKMQLTNGALHRAKHVGLAADLIQRLPVFDNAKVDEVLAIRRALERPLIRFRAAVMGFSESVDAAPWDEDFVMDTEKVFRQKVEPAVLEIEDAVRRDSYLRELISSLGKKEILLPTSGLGILLSSLGNFHKGVAAGLGVAVGVALAAWEAAEKRRQTTAILEAKQMYFYYHAGASLKQTQTVEDQA